MTPPLETVRRIGACRVCGAATQAGSRGPVPQLCPPHQVRASMGIRADAPDWSPGVCARCGAPFVRWQRPLAAGGRAYAGLYCSSSCSAIATAARRGATHHALAWPGSRRLLELALRALRAQCRPPEVPRTCGWCRARISQAGCPRERATGRVARPRRYCDQRCARQAQYARRLAQRPRELQELVLSASRPRPGVSA